MINLFWRLYDFSDFESSILGAKVRLHIRNSGDADQRPGSTWLTLGEGPIAVAIDHLHSRNSCPQTGRSAGGTSRSIESAIESTFRPDRVPSREPY